MSHIEAGGNRSHEFDEIFKDTPLAKATAPAPDDVLNLGSSSHKELILEERQDIARGYSEYLREKDRAIKEAPNEARRRILRGHVSYRIPTYRSVALSQSSFIDLVDTDINAAELIWRQTAKMYLAKGHKRVDGVNVDLKARKEFAKAFSAEDLVIESRFSYDTGQKDRWENALFAHKLITDPDFITRFKGTQDLTRYAVNNGLNLDLNQLKEGFYDLVSDDSFNQLLEAGILGNEEVDAYFSRIAAWLADMSLVQTFEDKRGKVQGIYPFAIGAPTFTAEGKVVFRPTIHYLPEMVASFLYFVEEIPERIKVGQMFEPARQLVMQGNMYQYVRDVLLMHVAENIPGVDVREEVRNAPKYDPHVSLEAGLMRMFHGPLRAIYSKLYASSDVDPKKKQEIREEVEMYANLCLALKAELDQVYHRHGEDVRLWDRRSFKEEVEGKSELPSFADIRQKIIDAGGDSARSRRTTLERLKSHVRKSEDR